MVEQARALRRHGHEVTLLCVLQGAATDGWRVSEDDAGLSSGIPRLRVQYPAVKLAWYLPCVAGFLLGCRRAFRHLRPDVIHAHVTLPVGLAAVAARRMLGVPVVITEHGGPLRAIMGGRRSVARAMRWALQGADAAIAVSEHLRVEIKAEAGVSRTVDVVPNLFDPDQFVPAPRPAAAALDVLFLGRAGDPRKGNDLMLRAFALARARSHQRLRLVVVGPGLEEELRPLAGELGVTADCVFKGALAPPTLAAVMREAAFLVMPSRYETFGLALVEAMACGRPVIATRCGGPEELVTPETGSLVAVDDEGALAAAILEMAAGLGDYAVDAIARYARDRFCDRVVVRELERVYRRAARVD